jgi:hypothetical protein
VPVIPDKLLTPTPESDPVIPIVPVPVIAPPLRESPLTGVVEAVMDLTPTLTSPEPSRLVLSTVLMLVPLTKVACLLLNVFQSVLVNAPLVDVFAVAILTVGLTVAVPVIDRGETALTEVTVPVPLAPRRLVTVTFLVAPDCHSGTSSPPDNGVSAGGNPSIVVVLSEDMVS